MDIAYYRCCERLARSGCSDYRVAGAFVPPAFVETGFPTRIESIADLTYLVDSMQGNRFEAYQTENGGFCDDEVGLLIEALRRFWSISRGHISPASCIVPLSSMTTHLVNYRKIARLPGRKSILEIGPGCGFNSFFVHQDSNVENYVQIEVTEPFYLLQSIINAAMFGLRHKEHASLGRVPQEYLNVDSRFVFHAEHPPVLDLNLPTRCHHLPWWKMRTAYDFRYDVVVMNSNISEFSAEAFVTYANLIGETLSDDGHVLIDSLGGGKLDPGFIFMHLLERGMVPIFMSPQNGEIGGRRFASHNFVLVKRTHSLFWKYSQRFSGLGGNLHPGITDQDEPVIRAIFGLDENKVRRVYGRDELVARLRDALTS